MDAKDIYTNRWVQIGVASTILVGGGTIAGIYIWKRYRKSHYPKLKPVEDKQLRLNLIDPTPRSAPSREDVRRSRYGKEKYEEMRQLMDESGYSDTPTKDDIYVDPDLNVGVDLSQPEEKVDDSESPSVDDYEDNSFEIVAETGLVLDLERTNFNIFKAYGSEWDADAELASRVPDKPYVIHEDEFIQGESGYKQNTLTYYAGDDIMADHEDTPIYNHEGLLGELKFGHGSNDPMVVYIRNDSVRGEWEIILNDKKFAIEVMGHEYEDQEDTSLQHSVQKFRGE